MAKTDDLPGVEGEGVSPKRIKRLDNAVGQWRAIVVERQALTEKEVESRDKVLQIMHAEGIQKYHYYDEDDVKKLLVLESSEKVKLKAIKDGEDEEPATEDADEY